MKPKSWFGIFTYMLGDLVAAMVAWTSFFLGRKVIMEKVPFDWSLLNDANYYYGIILIPAGWMFLYIVIDSYKDIYRISRMNMLYQTFVISAIGVLILFFGLLLNDWIPRYQAYYWLLASLFALHYGITVFVRLSILTYAKYQLRTGKVGYNTIVIGGNKRAVDLYNNINSRRNRIGYNFIGFIDSNGNSTNELEEQLPKLGKLDQLASVIEGERIEEVIIAIETSDHAKLRNTLSTLFDYPVVIKLIPDMYDILLGSVKMSNVYGAILIEIYPEIMPLWQRLSKRILDIILSVVALLVLSPVYLIIMLMVRLSSEGPIFYRQERIGRHGIPFNIIKFRSMYVNSEQGTPQLSQDNDSRITKWGGIMRKLRLDELPQFWNVVKGEMSLVGPRPERRFFIDQIVEHAPHYKQLLKVRPGITSWGQVKFGYASNLEEMLERLKFDILYIENMSLGLDFRILLATILTVIQGRGK